MATSFYSGNGAGNGQFYHGEEAGHFSQEADPEVSEHSQSSTFEQPQGDQWYESSWGARQWPSYGGWGSRRASDDSTWGWTWSSWHGSNWSESSDGKWWHTPKGWVWGKTLDDGINYAVRNSWFGLDRAFCGWWNAQEAGFGSGSMDDRESSKEAGTGSYEHGSGERDSKGSEKDFKMSTHGDDEDDEDSDKKNKRRYSGKEHVPEHDGEISMREYQRRVRIFQSTSSISEEFQAGKLLERLRGDAWKAAETIEVSQLKCKDGVEKLLRHLWDEMEPLEYLRVFQTLSYFFDHFHRVRGQEMTQYDTAFRTQCQRLAEAQSPLEGRAKAYWFLKKAGIGEELRRQVVSSAGGEYDYLKLRSALVAIVPQVRRHDAEDSGKRDQRPQQRGRSPGGAHRVNAVLEDEGVDVMDEDGGSNGETYDDGCQADELEMEAEVLLTAAARKRAQFTKGRGFEKSRSESPQARQRRIDDMKKRMPCAACKAAGRLVYGHWHSDPECPEFGKKAAAVKSESNSKSVFVVTQPGDEQDESDNDDAFLIHVIFMATAEKLREESAFLALTDTACARSVAGECWANHVLDFMVKQGIPFYVVDDHQPFRFGDGPRTRARYAMVIPVALAVETDPILLRISVVKEDVPLLLSAKTLKKLGTVLDMEDDKYQFKRIGARKEMVHTSTGHIGFELFETLPAAEDLLQIDWEGFVQSNDEVVFLKGNPLMDQDCGNVKPVSPNTPGPRRNVSGKSVRFQEIPEIYVVEDICTPENDGLSSEDQHGFLGDSTIASTLSEFNDGNYSSQAQGRLCPIDCGENQSQCDGFEGDDCREVEGDLQGHEGEESESFACELASLCKSGTSRTVRGEGGSVVSPRHQQGQDLSQLDPRSTDHRARDLCPRGEGEWRANRWNGRRSQGQDPNLSDMFGEDVGSVQPSNGGAILRMCGLSKVQRDNGLGVLRSTSRNRPETASGERQGSFQGRGLSSQARDPGRDRGDGWSANSAGTSWIKSVGAKLGMAGEWIRGFRDAKSCEQGFGRPSGLDARGEEAGQGTSQGGEEVSTDWSAQPDDPETVRAKIREGNRRRKFAKLGTCRRLIGNCKALAGLICLMTVATVGSSVNKFHESFYGTDRPDVVEIFGGAAEVSLQFAHRGWSVMQPTDLIYGENLRKPQTRIEVVERIKRERPRLVIMSWPCRLWSKLADTNYRSPQERRRLAKLRKEEEPFLEMCEEIFNEQIRRGDDALSENPLCSKSWAVPAMRRVLDHPQVFAGVSHGCRLGVKSSATGELLKKPTLWVSTSPEICDALAVRCRNRPGHVDHEHGECQGGNVSKHAGRYTPEIAKAIHKGFTLTLRRKDPNRLIQLVRAVKKRLGKPGEKDKLLGWTADGVNRILQENNVFVNEQASRVENPDEAMPSVVKTEQDEGYEPGGIPESGISFLVPPGKKLDAAAKSVLRKIHNNLGHPSVQDMQRFMKTAGANQELIEAVSWLRCSSCAQSQRPRFHRTTRMPPHDLQFNDQVMVDCFHTKDSVGKGYWFMSVLDRATMYHQVSWIGDHSPETFARVMINQWIKWAGSPGEISIDMERGFGSQDFADQMGEAGCVVVPIAGQAHWQHGKIERHGQIVKEMMQKVIAQCQAKGILEMSWVAIEVSNAKNMLVREHGFSPNQLLFGKEPRNFGEIEENGEPCAFHFGVGERGTQVALRMKYRHHARQSFIQSQASQMLDRTVRNRSRKWEEPKIGDKCFFYREVRKKDQKGVVSCWRGPALVAGIQGQSNYWVVFGGRCYLVAQEHLREAVGEEALFGKPEVQEAISIFKDTSNKNEGTPYIDLTDQNKPDDETLDEPVDEMDDDDDDDDELVPDVPSRVVQNRFDEPPESVKKHVASPGWHEDGLGNPMLVCHRAYCLRTPMPRFDGSTHPYRTSWALFDREWIRIEKDVNWTTLDDSHEALVGGPAGVLVCVFSQKTRKQICNDSLPECLKRRRVGEQEVFWESFLTTASRRKAQKALDKEIPFGKIPSKDKELFEKAEQKEWQSWLDYDAVELLDKSESERIMETKHDRVLRSRFVYRDKNAGLVDELGAKLAVKAKARLCVQGQHCPDCATGEVRVDAPTVQHSTLMLFLHLTVSFGWIPNWRNGDISSAFLQGSESKGEPLYMKPPERGLPGIGEGQLLRLKRPVYGRPDAPRAWYEQLSSFIMSEMNFERSIIDPAFFIHRRDNGTPDGLLVLHVDGLMVATDGGNDVEKKVRQLCDRFPFGEWETVKDQVGGTTYCGKEIVVEKHDGEDVICMRQRGFVDGRLESIPISKERKAHPEDKATPEEISDFRSVLGALQWLATQSRPDVAFSVNQLQKRVNCLEVKDLEVANQIVRIVKKNEVSLVFRNLGKNVAVVSFHDAGLYNSLGVEIDEDDGDHLQTFRDKRLLYSQKGCIVGLVNQSDLERTEPVPLNILSWRSKSNKRIIESSFAAETHAALMGYGNGHFMRVLLLEVYNGSYAVKQGEGTDWFSQTPLIMATDCKSVFDCIKKDAQSIGDKSNAINVAILRQLCSGENHPVGEKARLLWLPTRHQLADGLTKGGKASEMQSALKTGTAVFHGLSAKSLRLTKESSISVKVASDFDSSSKEPSRESIG